MTETLGDPVFGIEICFRARIVLFVVKVSSMNRTAVLRRDTVSVELLYHDGVTTEVTVMGTVQLILSSMETGWMYHDIKWNDGIYFVFYRTKI